MNYVVRSGSKANELRKVAVERKFIALEISAKRLGKRPWYHASHHLWFGRCFSFLSFFLHLPLALLMTSSSKAASSACIFGAAGGRSLRWSW